MRTQVHSRANEQVKHSTGPMGVVLQPKCSCGLTGSCAACAQKKTETLQRSPTRASTRVLPDSSFGHDFGKVRIHSTDITSQLNESLSPHEPGTRSSDISAQHVSVKGQLLGDESTSSEERSETLTESSEETVVEPSEPGIETAGNANCPVTAVFSSTLAGQEKANCRVPDKQFGAATLARFTLHGVQPGSGSQTVTEQFKSLKDNYGVFGLLKPNSFTTSGSIFDDCYILASPKPLPSDLELQVEQNHLLNGQIISKNIVTYTPSRISIRSCRRLPGSCDFASVCRR